MNRTYYTMLMLFACTIREHSIWRIPAIRFVHWQDNFVCFLQELVESKRFKVTWKIERESTSNIKQNLGNLQIRAKCTLYPEPEPRKNNQL